MKSSASIYESAGLQVLRTTTGIQSGPDAFDKSRFVMTFSAILGVTEICSFRLVLQGKTGKEILQSSRWEFIEKFLANSFALSDAEDNTSGTFSRTLLTILQNFWELMDSFVLVAYASLADWRTLLKQLPACLNFTLDLEDLLFCFKQKNNFSQLWQQHKQLKTMQMSQAWPDIYDKWYIHQLQPETTDKIP